MEKMKVSEKYIKKLRELSDKNANNPKGYSLGDVLLLDMLEKKLIDKCKFTRENVKKFSPSYYCT